MPNQNSARGPTGQAELGEAGGAVLLVDGVAGDPGHERRGGGEHDHEHDHADRHQRGAVPSQPGERQLGRRAGGPNGGWPQYYPPGNGYEKHITYNDGCMIRLMFFLREVSREDDHYGFVDASKRKACAAAWDKGIDCIVKTQVTVDGKLTSWCAQHDEVTFARHRP